MWTVEQRQAHDRAGLRYPSDLTDAEWSLVEPFIPPARRGGRRRTVDAREVLNGIFYVLATDCQWRALPKDLPPTSTVHDYLTLWAWDGTLRRLHHALFVQARERVGEQDGVGGRGGVGLLHRLTQGEHVVARVHHVRRGGHRECRHAASPLARSVRVRA